MTFLMGACASIPKTRLIEHLDTSAPPATKIHLAFIPQEKNMCGPSVLKMASTPYLPDYSLASIKEMTFREEAQGSFKADILSSARRMGLAPYRVSSLSAMLKEVQAKRPVVVFQNLGVSWLAAWHFALLVGYDASTDEVYLHSGTTAYENMPFHRFVGTWTRGEKWSYVLTAPEEIPEEATPTEATDNALLFEKLAKSLEAKKLYQAMIEKWPTHFEPHLGLASLYYSEKKLPQALAESEAAVAKAPREPALLFNLASLYFEAGQKSKAQIYKARTLAVVPAQEREEYLKRFDF